MNDPNFERSWRSRLGKGRDAPAASEDSERSDTDDSSLDEPSELDIRNRPSEWTDEDFEPDDVGDESKPSDAAELDIRNGPSEWTDEDFEPDDVAEESTPGSAVASGASLTGLGERPKASLGQAGPKIGRTRDPAGGASEPSDAGTRIGGRRPARSPNGVGGSVSGDGSSSGDDAWPVARSESKSLVGRRNPTADRDSRPPQSGGGQVLRSGDRLPIEYAPASAYAEPLDDFRLDLRKYFWLVFKHRWLILSATAVVLCGGLVFTLLTTPIYRASATIQISRDVDRVVNVEGFQQADAGRDVEFYQTQYELLKSRSLADRVVTELNLQDDPAFLKADAPSPWTRLKRLVFGEPDTGGVTADVSTRQKAAAARVLDDLSVAPVRSSSIVQLSFDSPDPRVAQKVVNALADSYINVNLERRYASSTYARKFLEERLQQLKLKLEESEKELVAYAEAKGIVTTGDSSNQTLAMTNLTNANTELSKATTERLRAELLWKQIASVVGLAVPKILESEAIGKMRAKRVELETEYQDKLSFFKPAFPEMKQLKAQIDEIDRQVSAEVALIKESVKAQYEAALSEEKKLAERVEELKHEVTDFRNRNIQYNILQREVDTNRSLYDGLLQRYKEIGVAGGVGSNNVSIVDAAEVPGAAYTPRLSLNLIMALMLGLMVGGALAFAREHFDDTFKSPEDLEENLGLPLLGIIPLVRNVESPDRFVDDPRSAAAEAYRSLRTAVQFSTSEGAPKTLLVTSSRPGEGKSTTALTLAKNFADLGLRVLLIDGDLRKPSLHQYLAKEHDAGLTNYLAGNVSPPEAFQGTNIDGLTFMASGPIPPNPAELLAGPKMLSLLTVASQKFDLVVIDGPPVSGLADAPLLSSMAEGTLLVVDVGGTGRGAARAALKRLHFARAQMIGVMANKVDMSGRAYGYGYGYGYGDDSYYGVDKPALVGEKPAEIADARKP